MKQKIIKYVRVSTSEQHTERQIENGIESYIDICSGSVLFSERPSAKELLKAVELGNIKEVKIHALDRLGRNLRDILDTVSYLTDNNVNLRSEKEGLSTLLPNGNESPVAKLLIGILGSVSEMERERLLERQKEGIAIAKARGVYKGRNLGTVESEIVFMNKSKSVTIARHLRNGESLRRASLLSKASLGTVQKVSKILQNRATE